MSTDGIGNFNSQDPRPNKKSGLTSIDTVTLMGLIGNGTYKKVRFGKKACKNYLNTYCISRLLVHSQPNLFNLWGAEPVLS